MKIDTKDLSPDLWRDVERLFGENGACGGCWCMSWRSEKGEKWPAIKGAEAKRRFKELVTTGKAHGVLAYVNGEPVGWCSFDRRKDYSKLDRAPTLKCDDAADVWSMPCFYVRSGYRGRGVASALLEHGIIALKKHGAKTVESYPAKPTKDGTPIPAAFAFTGTRSLFEANGFAVVGNDEGGKVRMRLLL